jgi:hypothetical protein
MWVESQEVVVALSEYYSGISLYTKRITKHLSQDSLPPAWYLEKRLFQNHQQFTEQVFETYPPCSYVWNNIPFLHQFSLIFGHCSAEQNSWCVVYMQVNLIFNFFKLQFMVYVNMLSEPKQLSK